MFNSARGVLGAVLLPAALVSCVVRDFCTELRLPEGEAAGKLGFTKEPRPKEFGLDGKYKSLHCCARGYRSVEWFKDGVPYPWPVQRSGLILYPESANQTIYTQSLRPSDSGVYTCTVRNDTTAIRHTMNLTVFESEGYMEKPLWTYRPKKQTKVMLGGQARMFCEAFVGHIDLPDAKSEAIWDKNGNASFIISDRMREINVRREGGEVLGSYIIIDDVKPSDLTTYTCTISNTGDQKISVSTELIANQGELKPLCFGGKTTLIFALLGFTTLLGLAFCAIKILSRKNDKLRLFWNKIAQKAMFNNDKLSKKAGGVVILYKNEDANFVENTLLPALVEKCPYNIFPHNLANDGTLTAESKEMVLKVGRQVVVFSPSVTRGWTQPLVIAALQNLIIVPQHCILTLEPLPGKNDDCSFDFDSLMKRYKVVGWFSRAGDVEGEGKAAGRMVDCLSSLQVCGREAVPPPRAEPTPSVNTWRSTFLAKVHLPNGKRSPEAHV